MMNKKTNKLVKIVIVVLVVFSITGLRYNLRDKDINSKIFYEISNIPEYNGEIYIEINNNVPEFSDDDFNIKQDYYSELKNEKVR